MGRLVDGMNKRMVWTAIGVLVLSACGAGPASRTNSSAGGSSESISPLPAIEVEDVTGDRRVALDAFVPADRPTLVWFWAPH